MQSSQWTAHLDVLGGTRLDQHAGAMLHSPSDDHLLGDAITLLANLPDDGILQITTPDFEIFGTVAHSSTKWVKLDVQIDAKEDSSTQVTC